MTLGIIKPVKVSSGAPNYSKAIGNGILSRGWSSNANRVPMRQSTALAASSSDYVVSDS